MADFRIFDIEIFYPSRVFTHLIELVDMNFFAQLGKKISMSKILKSANIFTCLQINGIPFLSVGPPLGLGLTKARRQSFSWKLYLKNP